MPKPTDAKFCTATVDEDGELTVEYRHRKGGKIGRLAYDENVGGWTDDQIKKLIRILTDYVGEIEIDSMYIPEDLDEKFAL